MIRRKKAPEHWQIYLLLLFLFCFSMETSADDWPQWRGPNRNGVSGEKGLITTWPEQGPQILWRISIGDGFSAISIAHGSVYTIWAEGEDEYLHCLDASTGNKRWQFRVGPVFREDHGDGPRSAPTIENDMVYVTGSQGHFHAVHAIKGNPLWSHDLVREYGTVIPKWGYSCSPLIEGNSVILDVGGEDGYAFMAFDKTNGRAIWNSHTDKLAYSSPMAFTINGRRQIIFFNESGLHAVSPENGEVFWHYEWEGGINIATPIFIAPANIFISCSYGKGAVLLKITDREGRCSVDPVWTNERMRNHFNSSVLVGNYLYGFDDAVLKCIAADTGEEKWFKRRLGKGSLIYADGQFIVLSERGRLILLEANPDEYKETASFQILKGRCWTPPSFAFGRLFLRNREEIVCLSLMSRGSGGK